MRSLLPHSPLLVVIDTGTMDVTRWHGRCCTHRGYRLDVRSEDNFSKAAIMGVVETFRTLPHNVKVVEYEPKLA